MTGSKRSNVFAIGFDQFAGLGEPANLDLSRLVISASRPLYPQTGSVGVIVFKNDVANIAISRIWEQLTHQSKDQPRAGRFTLRMQDLTTHGATVSTVIYLGCIIKQVEISAFDHGAPDSQRIEVTYAFDQVDVSATAFNGAI